MTSHFAFCLKFSDVYFYQQSHKLVWMFGLPKKASLQGFVKKPAVSYNYMLVSNNFEMHLIILEFFMCLKFSRNI